MSEHLPSSAEPDDAPSLGTDGERGGGRLQRDARTVAGALRVASTVLAVPAAAVAAAAAVGLAVLAALAGIALADGATPARWIWLALALAGLITVLVFVLRVLRTWRAARDPEALAGELIGLTDLSAVTTAMVADVADLTSREGGVRAVSRARALVRVLRRLDVGEHTSSFERARWFVPPDLGSTWLLAQITTWGGLVAWLLVPSSIAARAAGWL